MESVKLTQLDFLPEGLLDCDAADLHTVLEGPTLIHLQGVNPQPLFVCVLQHGNEDTGWLAVRELLTDYQGREMPRALSIFISNVQAARYGVRRLEHQIDYNRVWPGCDSSGTDEHLLMREVWEIMRNRQVFVSIDIHNNSGRNPHYGCINRLEPGFLNLAQRFSQTIVYFIRPTGVQSLAFAQLCPSVTVECGLIGDQTGVSHARRYIEEILRLESLDDLSSSGDQYDLFHTVAIVRIPEHLQVAFGDQPGDIMLREDIDSLNFREQPAGTLIGTAREAEKVRLEAWDESGQEVAATYFEMADGEIRTTRPVMPSMLTRDARVIRQDCLCYLMERIDPHKQQS